MGKNMEFRSFYKLSILLVVSLFTFHFSFLTVSSHRFHTTLTRIDVNEKEKKAEISIQMFTHDVNEVFEKKYAKKIDLEKKEEASKLILEFIESGFVLKNKKGEVSKLQFVGYEKDADSMWVYLETDISESLEGFQLKNSLFFDNYPEQSNIVICRYLGKKADLAFKVGDVFKEINAKTQK
jgi:hypothetical protein